MLGIRDLKTRHDLVEDPGHQAWHVPFNHIHCRTGQHAVFGMIPLGPASAMGNLSSQTSMFASMTQGLYIYLHFKAENLKSTARDLN